MVPRAGVSAASGSPAGPSSAPGQKDKAWDAALGRKLLRCSKRYIEFEKNTRETNEFFDGQLAEKLLRESAHRQAADTLLKMMERLSLVNIWHTSAPGLLQGKKINIELFPEGSPEYKEEFTQKLRIEKLSEALIRLKSIENSRPIRKEDVALEESKLRAIARAEKEKIELLQEQRQEALRKIGDGSDVAEEMAAAVTLSHSTNVLVLAGRGLLAIPPELFELSNLELLDLQDNAIAELPADVFKLHRLRKLYLSNNAIAAVPIELGRISRSLVVLALNGNPLEAALMEKYLEGVSSFMKHLVDKAEAEREERRAARRARRLEKLRAKAGSAGPGSVAGARTRSQSVAGSVKSAASAGTGGTAGTQR